MERANARVRTTVVPWLTVRGKGKAENFYQAAFGAVVRYRIEDPTGAVVAKLAVDDAEFWISDGAPENGEDSDLKRECAVRMILTVADPDATFAQAVAAGAAVVFPVGEEHGWRLGRVVDPFGFHWEIGREL